GTTTVAGKRALVHRVAWELAHGAIPVGKVICHRCDNPVCVNVGHLFIGTQQDNVRDAWAKGRGRAPWQVTH
ncbi:MAG: HNH endonuclease, partial [Bradyrhizobium sp.]|nr:HNH endonuclease [Bradyrhizobium sp.]